MKSLAEVLLGQRRNKTVSVGEHKIMYQTLTAGEQAEINRMASGLDPYAHIEASKVPTLARSIVSIDGVPLDGLKEVRELLRREPDVQTVVAIERCLYDLDKESINLYYSFYLELERERAEEREKLKNASRVQSEESSGKSLPSSEATQ